MDTKSLLVGIISFIAGALLVSTAATTFDQASLNPDSMSVMTKSLKRKTGDDFDREFLAQMIVHHAGAVDMAHEAKDKAKHQEVKDLADEIIAAQKQEIDQMKQWQKKWGYPSSSAASHGH